MPTTVFALTPSSIIYVPKAKACLHWQFLPNIWTLKHHLPYLPWLLVLQMPKEPR